MTDPQRRAVQDRAMDAITESRRVTRGIDRHVPVNTPAGDAAVILAAIRAADLVIVNRADVEGALDAMQYVKDTYFWDKHGYQATEDSLRGSLGDD